MLESKYLSPIGVIYLKLENGQLTQLEFLDNDIMELKNAKEVASFYPICEWLDEYFKGEVPKDFPKIKLIGTDFQKAVWDILLSIPYGHWVSYGEIAKKLETKLHRHMSAQAVGQAVGANPIAIMIPCHRVLGRDMSLTGFRGGIERKKTLLEMEGYKDGSFKKYDL